MREIINSVPLFDQIQIHAILFKKIIRFMFFIVAVDDDVLCFKLNKNSF